MGAQGDRDRTVRNAGSRGPARKIWRHEATPGCARYGFAPHDDPDGRADRNTRRTRRRRSLVQLQHILDTRPCRCRNSRAASTMGNPFTLGHRHLVGCAAKMVDGLYLFVVQEDKSFFPFQDRLSLVRQGVKHISTPIHVVPSGEFIISNLVFPGYFAETRAITGLNRRCRNFRIDHCAGIGNNAPLCRRGAELRDNE